MSTHYATLGLPASASAADIRQAYRRLVWLTHPDRTPDPAAHQRYLAVNEAYDVLRDPTRRATYDAALEWRARARAAAPVAPPAGFSRPDPRRRTRPAAAARRPVAPPPARYAAQFTVARPWLKAVAAFTLLFVVLLLIDQSTSRTLRNETVREMNYVVYRGKGGAPISSYFVAHTPHARFRIPVTFDLNVGDRVRVEQDRWLGRVRAVWVLSGNERGQQQRPELPGLWGPLLVWTAAAALATLQRRNPEQVFSVGFVCCLLLALMLWLYFP